MQCRHLDASKDVQPRTPDGCEECLAMGDEWVHLRLCMSCGHVGCCDDSKNRHARAHAGTGSHPIVRSFEPGERWLYCFIDDEVVGEAYVAGQELADTIAGFALFADLSTPQREQVVAVLSEQWFG